MTGRVSLTAIYCVCIAATFCQQVPLNAQERAATKTPPPMVLPTARPPADTGPPASFSLDSPDEMANLGRNLQAARSSSVRFLNQFARGESKDEMKAAWAAAFLAEIRSDDEQSILALCANIGKGISTGDEKWGGSSLSNWAWRGLGASKNWRVARERYDDRKDAARTQ